MRDIFEDIFENQPLDPTEAARRGMRPQLRRRFYTDVSIKESEGGFALALDGRPVRTPARRPLAAPARALAEAMADEWRAQDGVIAPAKMPLARLANSIIDGVADAAAPVAAEIENYLACDLLFYRAHDPPRLVERQAQHWDPLIAWAREALGARFVLAEGIMHVAQPESALVAAGKHIPRNAQSAAEIWKLGALHAITTLTGSALLALAVLHRRITADEAWAAAQVDEDWNFELWGRDEVALQHRAFRFAEMQAAATVLELTDARSG